MIEVRDLSKNYGSTQALQSVGFRLEAGQICALLGPNGAGKSTLLKILTTYLHPDQGDVTYTGDSIFNQSTQYKAQLGYLPEHNPLYDEQYVAEYIQLAASFYGATLADVQQAIRDTGLQAFAQHKIGSLSKGYRQRVGLAAAIAHHPKVLILDEPTTGLDPNQIVEIRQLIKNISADKIVILSTHLMQEVEAICDRVLILNQGRLVEDNTLLQVKNQERRYTLEVDRPIEIEWLSAMDGFVSAQSMGNNTWDIGVQPDCDPRAAWFDLAMAKGFKILALSQQNQSMEHVFRDKTQGP